MSEFSFSSVENFDEHIDKSIRGYSDLIGDVCAMSRFFVEDGTNVVDVGCSTGVMLENISVINDKLDVSYVGIEIEDNFTKDLHDHDDVSYFKGDVVDFDGWANTSMVTSIFTLQFMSKASRVSTVKNIYDSLIPGGVFIFSEKVYFDDAKTDDIVSSIHYDYKRKSFSASDVLDKEHSLRSIMRPDVKSDLVGDDGYIKACGFSKCFQFWQNHNFCGWVAVK